MATNAFGKAVVTRVAITDLAAVADDCVVLDLGKVIATGDPLTVFENPRVKEAYFENADA